MPVLAAIGPLMIKMLSGLAMKLLSEKLLEELLLWSLEKMAQSTRTKVDDQLYKLVKEHLDGKE